MQGILSHETNCVECVRNTGFYLLPETWCNKKKAENKYMSAGPITSLSLEQQTES